MSRRRSREVALQVLFAADVAKREPGAPSAEAMFELVAEQFELPEGARAHAKTLVTGVTSLCDELDRRLAKHARNWKVSRMAAVDRNILRMSTYELLRTDAPVEVILDEAIELARRFGGDASTTFVNGVLDAVARELSATRGESGA